jgi:hypothetical protein
MRESRGRALRMRHENWIARRSLKAAAFIRNARRKAVPTFRLSEAASHNDNILLASSANGLWLK